MNATDKLLAADPTKTVVSHKERFGPTSGDHGFSHSDLKHLQDPTGIACEEGELLYGLVRVCKPKHILETGTNVGVSAQYMAQALKDIGGGDLNTIEKDGTCAKVARDKFEKMGYSAFVHVSCCMTSEFFKNIPADKMFDFLWLDTEPRERYAELVTLFPRVTPGGIICIHDLWELDHHWYGGVPEEMKKLIKNGDLRGLTFQTDHGVAVFQKRREKDYFADLLKS